MPQSKVDHMAMLIKKARQAETTYSRTKTATDLTDVIRTAARVKEVVQEEPEKEQHKAGVPLGQRWDR